MLVLTRKEGEIIVVGRGTDSELTFTIRQIKGGKVSIGIEAPRDVPIVRGELKETE